MKANQIDANLNTKDPKITRLPERPTPESQYEEPKQESQPSPNLKEAIDNFKYYNDTYILTDSNTYKQPDIDMVNLLFAIYNEIRLMRLKLEGKK